MVLTDRYEKNGPFTVENGNSDADVPSQTTIVTIVYQRVSGVMLTQLSLE
jgi:hypothetical protein